MTTTDPTTIDGDQLRVALAALGIGDHDTIRQVTIQPGRVIVERYVRDKNGHFYLDHGFARVWRWLRGQERDVVTSVTTIRVKYGTRETR